MYPVNQVFLGGDPLLNGKSVGIDIEEQLRQLEARKKALESARQLNTQAVQPTAAIWNEIDSEMSALSNEQKERLFNNQEYAELNYILNSMVQTELLELVKYKIEASPKGKSLLEDQLKLLKKLKSKIVEDTNKEMELFKRFQAASQTNPELTYEQFKQTLK